MAYTPKTWVTGETIQAADLNHMESGIEAISANGAIGTSNLASAAVTSDKIANNSITDDELADGAVVTAKIEDGAVTTAKIASGAVTAAKLDESATDIIADTFSTSSAYSAGDYVIYSGALYRFTADKTAGAWDSTKVTTVSLADDVSDVKGDLINNLLDYIETVNPSNWFDADGLVAGELKADGTIGESTTRKYTDYFIPVTEGSYVWYNRGDNFAGAYMRHLTAYDANKNVLSAKGSNSTNVKYLVQSGVAYVKVTIDNPLLSVLPMITVGDNAPTVYSAYFEPYKKLTKDFLTLESADVVTALKNKTLKSTNFANKYACSLPRTKIRQTVDIPETFYTNTARTPAKTTYSLFAFGDEYQERLTDDSVLLPNESAYTSVNGFIWRLYDSAFAEIANNLTSTYQSGLPRSILAENLSSCSLLAIGDSTVDQDVMTQKLLDHFATAGATLTLLGTLGSGNNKNEGRAGWKASDYLTDKQYSGVANPFYNPASETFDFNYYMTNQGYSAPDFVVIQLGINDLGSTNDYAAIWACIATMIDSILDYNSNIKILLNLPTTPTSDQSKIQSMYLPEYQNRVVNYDEYAILHALDEYGETKVKCSYCHIILDPDNDIFDNVHPTSAGYEKMALEIANQINHWQNGN